ncbi:MAG: sarcosine oxidase subunit gamma [Flavobacteriaceae bacterium]
MADTVADTVAGATRRSPLAHRDAIAAADGAAAMAERRFLGKFVLRGDAAKIGTAAKAALGVALPENGRLAIKGKTMVLATSPDEWLVICDGPAEAAINALSGKLSKLHHQIADVSDYYTTIRLSGPRARDMLQKITTRDMHRREFTPGACGGILLAHANPVIALLSDDSGGAVFDIHIRWSFADYLWCEIAHSGGEWGLPRQTPLHGERLVV